MSFDFLKSARSRACLTRDHVQAKHATSYIVLSVFGACRMRSGSKGILGKLAWIMRCYNSSSGDLASLT